MHDTVTQYSVDWALKTNDLSIYWIVLHQRLYHVKEVHSIFVTAVEFLPASEATQAIVGHQDFNLLSVSADNTIRLHQMPERGKGFLCLFYLQIVHWLLGWWAGQSVGQSVNKFCSFAKQNVT